MSAQGSDDRDSRLYALSEALGEARFAGELIDGKEWARRFDVEPSDVMRAMAALDVLDPGRILVGKPDHAPRPEPELPADYELVDELGAGGMGVVWRARQKSLDREVAVKVLAPAALGSGQGMERFQREAASLARLRHPGIARIHEVGRHAGHVYFSMELIEGQTMAQALAEESPWSVERTLHVMRQVGEAIAYVHGRGLVHRDLKPGNILIDRSGDACVVDFGLALDRDQSLALTHTGNVVGTPAYMAPEQARGDRSQVGEASDIYALGAILHECLAGQPPFGQRPLAELVHAVIYSDPTPLLEHNPKAPPALGHVVGKALAKKPADRYQTVGALLEDLERFEQGHRVLAEPPRLARGVARLAIREKRTLWIVLLSVTLALFVREYWTWSRDNGVHPFVTAAREMQAAGDFDGAAVFLTRAAAEGAELDLEEISLIPAVEMQRDPAGASSVYHVVNAAPKVGRHRVVGRQSSTLGSLTAVAAKVIEGAEALPDYHLGQLEWSDQESLAASLDVFEPAFVGSRAALWARVGWRLLADERVRPGILTWLASKGEEGDSMLVRWLAVEGATALTAGVPLPWTRQDQNVSNYLSERGRGLLAVARVQEGSSGSPALQALVESLQVVEEELPSADPDRALATLRRFDGARGKQRNTLHAELCRLGNPEAPIWPRFGGSPMPEPFGLGTLWHQILDPSSCDNMDLVWAWFEVNTEGTASDLAIAGRIGLPAGEEVPVPVNVGPVSFLGGYKTYRGPRYLGNGIPSFAESRTLLVRRDYRQGGGAGADPFQLSWVLPEQLARGDFDLLSRLADLTTPAQPLHAVARRRVSWSFPEGNRTFILSAKALPRGTPWDWEAAALGSPVGRDLLAVHTPDPPKKRGKSILDSTSNRIVLGSLAGFLLLSIGFGLVGGLRALRRRGMKWGDLLVNSAAILLPCLVGADAAMPNNIPISLRYIVPCVALAAACAPFGARALGCTSKSLVATVCWLACAVVGAWVQWGSGGATAWAWATLLWPLGVFAYAPVLMKALRSNGSAWGYVAMAGLLGVFYTVPLFSGISLVLGTVPHPDAQAVGLGIGSALERWTVARVLQFSSNGVPSILVAQQILNFSIVRASRMRQAAPPA